VNYFAATAALVRRSVNLNDTRNDTDKHPDVTATDGPAAASVHHDGSHYDGNAPVIHAPRTVSDQICGHQRVPQLNVTVTATDNCHSYTV